MEITGKTLIDLGYKPGKWFAEAIEQANKLNLEGQELEEMLKRMSPVAELMPHSLPKFFSQNIETFGLEEEWNLKNVRETMEAVMLTPTVTKGAIMPDACPAGPFGHIPVGGIVVARNAIHPAMHSADICCSVMATDFGMLNPKDVLDVAMKATHFGGGGRKDPLRVLQTSYIETLRSNPFLNDDRIIEMASSHLGTQGDGNHFLFIGRSERTGHTWMVTHHGSRGVGAALYNEGMKVAERYRKELSPKTLPMNAWIPFDTMEGQQYWEALQLVRDWTKANHDMIHGSVKSKFQKLECVEKSFWNEHNFVFKDGEDFYHAKGATPLRKDFVPDGHPDGIRIIPLNMAEPILFVKGDVTESNLGFAPHGAGRNISRSQHIRMSLAHNTVQEIFNQETEGLDVRFFSGNPDISELPSAYKNAKSVQEQIEKFGLGTVVDRILPYGCIMAGDWQKDAPWRKKKHSKE